MFSLSAHAEIQEMVDVDQRGIYHHYYHGEMTTRGPLDVLFIMLDVRYHRTTPGMLDADQWWWLEQLMLNIKNKRATKPHWTLFVMGSTFLFDQAEQPLSRGHDWDRESQRRLKELIRLSGISLDRVLMVSGTCEYFIIRSANMLKVEMFFCESVLR